MGGLLLVFKIEQFYVRHEMRARMECSKTIFEKIILSKSDYKKSRINSSEISLNGKMYDIKTETTLKDSVVLIVINDSNETNIVKKIKDCINGLNNPVQYPQKLHKIIALIYLPPINENAIFPCLTVIELFQNGIVKTITDHSNIFGPPPKLA